MTANKTNRFIIIIIPIALLAYLIPWAVNTSTGLTLGAYDLAEWLSLHPATHPTRLPSLFLRGQLLLITLSIALSVNKPLFTIGWWLRLIAVLLLTVAQLPPPEFLAWTGDLNQRQQAMLAIASLVGGSIAMTGLLVRYRDYFQIAVSSAGIITTLYVTAQIIPRMQEFGLSPAFGIGAFALISVYSIWMVFAGLTIRKENRVSKT